MKRLSVWGSLLTCFLVQSASGDHVVMLDINDSALEVHALEEVVRETGESHVVFPSDRGTDARRRFLAQQNVYLATLMSNRRNTNPKQYADWAKRKGEIAAELENLRSRIRLGPDTLTNSSDPKSMRSFLSTLARTSGPITLVISGHFYTHSHVKGELAQMNFEPLLQLLNGTIGWRVRRLLLWGCYGLNAQKAQTIWRAAFPNLEMAFGFVDTAPLNSTLAAPVLLRHVLSKREELGFASRERVSEVIGDSAVAAVTYWSLWNLRGYTQTNLTKPTPQPAQNQCVNEEALASSIDYWEKYQSGKIPALSQSSEDATHPLRVLYRAMQAARFPCLLKGSSRTPSFLHELFALLYFHHIKRLAAESWGPRLLEFVQLARAQGLRSAAGLIHLESMERNQISSVMQQIWVELLAEQRTVDEAEVLRRYRSLSLWNRWAQESPEKPHAKRVREERRRHLETLRVAWIQINATIVHNVERCVPVAWLSGQSAPSPCSP